MSYQIKRQMIISPMAKETEGSKDVTRRNHQEKRNKKIKRTKLQKPTLQEILYLNLATKKTIIPRILMSWE